MSDNFVPQQAAVTQQERLIAFVLPIFICWFFIVFVAGAYLNRAPIEHLLSFLGNDTPGSFPGSVFPRPFGVHFFGDFLLPRWQSIRPSPWFESDIRATPLNNYTPFTMAVFYLFAQVSYWKSFIFLLFISLVLIVLPIALSVPKRTRLQTLSVLVFLTAPFISLIDRGNIQILLIGILLSSLFLFKNSKFRLSAVLLGLAIAMKGYPVFLLVLLVKARRWFDIALALTTTVLVTMIPLLFYEGGIIRNISRMLRNIKLNETEYAHAALAYNSSLKGFFLSVSSFSIPFASAITDFLYDHYSVLILLISVASTLICIASRANCFEATLLAVTLMTATVDYVAPYALGLYFLPLIFINEWSPSMSNKKVVLIFVSWAFLLAPKGIPVAVWNTPLSSTATTYTSLFGGLCGFAILATLVSSMIKTTRVNFLTQKRA